MGEHIFQLVCMLHVGRSPKADIIKFGIRTFSHLQTFADGEGGHRLSEGSECLGGQICECGTTVQDCPIAFLVRLLQFQSITKQQSDLCQSAF